jgi:hypothetical protein
MGIPKLPTSPPDEAKEPSPYDEPLDLEAFGFDVTPRKRGKPRRAAGIAHVTTVRIDDVTKLRLQGAFGSLGNALYFIAQGLTQYRTILSRKDEASLKPDPAPDPDDLLPDELEAVQGIVYKHLDRLRDEDPYITPLFRALRKIERRAGKP